MSKIGRMPISIGNAKVEIKGQDVHYSGKNGSGVYIIPSDLTVEVSENNVFVKPSSLAKGRKRDINRVWGLHRALLFNAIHGVEKGFEKQIKITGLGFKAVLSGRRIVFSLGYSHKIDFDLPEEVSLEVDKSGQMLTVRSADKMLIGQVCSKIKELKKTEPYKGTGIKLTTDVIARKAGKAKSS